MVTRICEASKFSHSWVAISADLARVARVSSRSAFSGMGIEQVTRPRRTFNGAQPGCSQSARREKSSLSDTLRITYNTACRPKRNKIYIFFY